ncbi:glycosyltransferase [Aliarcobacter butzleri]|uniref:glycosyltransferase family 2 protein n=1 Tax=Aliarcobacter butzleri TaxID=28197 RepID=UPI0021B26297|nr:glycosyltransferase family 2 protein [Aliarcobacter butzleri]MCT7635630.1 glycosyltransferase [Aliarcobacter butzleri]
MEINKNLSIVIPTYNRADFLDYSLEVHIPMLKEYGIEIAIFDNASTDNTQEIVSKWMKEYDYLTYHKNETNIGPDANFEKALKYPDSDYVWLLGDTYKLSEEGVRYFLKQIENEKYDVLVFNLADKLNIQTKNYNDSNSLLNDLGALMTCLSCLVYNKIFLKKANFSRYYNSYFVQTGAIFESIANRDFNIHWIQEHSIDSLVNPNLKKTNWSHTPKAFEIGCEHWTNFVMSLPPMYKLENKMKCIMDFEKVSGLFTFRNLILLRTRGLIDIKVYNQYKNLFPFTIDYPPWIIYIISITPKYFFKILLKLYILTFKRNQIDNFKFLWKN